MGEFQDRVVVITGAGAGIGMAAARMCAQAGARLVLVDQHIGDLETAGTAFGQDVLIIAGDVADPETAPHYVAAAIERFGRIDAAMLNAGMAGRVSPIHQVTPSDFDRIMAVNVRSVWSGIAALFPPMAASGGGSIVVTASTGGVLGAPYVAPYIASKHAVIGLVKSASIEGARKGIRVNAVAPAPIDTAMMQQINTGLGGGDFEKSRARTIAHVPLQRYGTAEEVARMMLFLASDASSYSTGGVYLVDGGMSAGVYP